MIHLCIDDSKDDSNILDNITDIYLYLENNINIISSNKCEIISLKNSNNIITNNTDTNNDNALHMKLTTFNMLIEIINGKYEIQVWFSLDNDISSFLKTFIKTSLLISIFELSRILRLLSA